MRVNTLLFILLLAVLGTVPFIVRPPKEALPILGQVKAFKLTNSEGAEFSSSELQGKVWLTNFFFTSCQGICPATIAELRKIYRQFDSQEALHFVSISVDAKTDTPQVIKEYAKTHEIESSRWHLLTGDPKEVDRISTESFMIGTFADPSIHSDRVVLVDKKGQIRGFFSSRHEEELAALKEGIVELLRE